MRAVSHSAVPAGGGTTGSSAVAGTVSSTLTEDFGGTLTVQLASPRPRPGTATSAPGADRSAEPPESPKASPSGRGTITGAGCSLGSPALTTCMVARSDAMATTMV